MRYSIGYKVAINTNIIHNNKIVLHKNTEAVIIKVKDNDFVDVIIFNSFNPIIVLNIPTEYLTLIDVNVNYINVKNYLKENNYA